MNYFVKGNPMLCIGCRTCMVACVVAHEGPSIFTMHPDDADFQPRIKVVKTKSMTKTVQCHQCENAPCAAVCPTGALYKEAHHIAFESEQCIGCKQCVMACPFGAITMAVPDEKGRRVAHKCDLCTSTAEGAPACVSHCPTEALTFYTEDVQQQNITDKQIRSVRAASRVAGKEGA